MTISNFHFLYQLNFVCLFLHRTVREVSSTDQDKIISDSQVIEHLVTVLHSLHSNGESECHHAQFPGQGGSSTSAMYNALGFEIKRQESTIPGAGKGVVVSKGNIPMGSLVALYPGTRYTQFNN